MEKITFKKPKTVATMMPQKGNAQEVTSHSPDAKLVTIGHFQSVQSLVVVASVVLKLSLLLHLNSLQY